MTSYCSKLLIIGTVECVGTVKIRTGGRVLLLLYVRIGELLKDDSSRVTTRPPPIPGKLIQLHTVKIIHICGPTLHYSVNLRIQMYTEPVTLKYGKLATKYVDTQIFFTVHSGQRKSRVKL